MKNEQICSKCGNIMKKIPIKKFNSTYMIEYYCEKCGESRTFYTDFGKIMSDCQILF